MTKFAYNAACMFGGGGGMGFGMKSSSQRFREHAGSFELCGSYDFDPYACKVYEYLTGSPEAQLDARSITPGDVYRLFGGTSPHLVMISAPCKGSSKLLSSAKAATEKYIAMNDLSYRGVLTLLDAFPGDEPAFLLFENVPNITTRAKRMLTDLRRLLRERGYVLHDGFHEARHIGDLAQRRKRWFMVARNQRKVSVFLYKPPHKAGKVCGDVLGPLPLPGDAAGGPMHELPGTSMINLLRLWAIPAGGDWRDLLPDDGTPRRARFRRHHVERWNEPSVTIGGSGSNGPCGVADPRAEGDGLELGRRAAFKHVDRVTSWDQATGTVTAAASPSNGAPSVADPRPINLLDPDGTAGNPEWFDGKYTIGQWDRPTKTVIGQGAGNGGNYVADPRLDLARARPGFTSMDHVLRWEQPSRTITGATRPGNGAPSVADPRPVSLAPEGGSWFNGAVGVTDWSDPTRTVIGGRYNGAVNVADPRVPQGAPSVVDLSLPPETFHHVNRVTAWDDATGTVTHAPSPSSGAPSVADPGVDLVKGCTGFGNYGVAPWDGASRTVIASSGANGASAVSDPRLPQRFKDSLGVLGPKDVAGTVTGEAQPSTGRFSYAAPLPPELRPQAGNVDLHWGKYRVVPWNDAAQTVTGASRVGSGAPSVADPRVDLSTADSAFHHGSGPGRWGVLSPLDTSSTVIGNARVNTGPFSYAAAPPVAVNLVPSEKCYDAGYGVLRHDQPSRTVAATSAVGCGAYAIADDVPEPVDLELGCAPHAGAYGVTSFDDVAATVTAHHEVDNRPAAIADPRPAPYVVLSYEETRRIVGGEVAVPFAIVDPAQPGEPLAIVDDLKRPPFRWVETRSARGKITRRRQPVALVLISDDGTWHRPLTTLELAVLQGLPWQHRGAPLDFGGGTTAQRETIGNMVPPPVAKAMAEQMLLSLLVSSTVGFALGDPGTPVWVKNVRRLERDLRREGYVVVKGRRPMNFTTGEFLDDGATRWRAPITKKRRTRRASSPMRPMAALEAEHGALSH